MVEYYCYGWLHWLVFTLQFLEETRVNDVITKLYLLCLLVQILIKIYHVLETPCRPVFILKIAICIHACI